MECGGSVTLAGWPRYLWSSRPAGICPSSSVKRSRCHAPGVWRCGGSLGSWVVIRRRSRGNCAATRRPAAVRSSTGQRSRSGRRKWRLSDQSRAKLATNPRLRGYVRERLAGQLEGPDGVVVSGPVTTWKGRNKPHRADRPWARAWSPEQISRRLVVDFPDDEDMRISHEAIYEALYIEGRGALKRELVARLRTGRALRKPRARTRDRPQGHVTADVVLSERPAEAEDRAVPGHWEGDLIIGTGRSAIGTIVERSSRYTLLVHLPRLEGYGRPGSTTGDATARSSTVAAASPPQQHMKPSSTVRQPPPPRRQPNSQSLYETRGASGRRRPELPGLRCPALRRPVRSAEAVHTRRQWTRHRRPDRRLPHGRVLVAGHGPAPPP